MSEFEKGQTIWVLEDENEVEDTISIRIIKCKYSSQENEVYHNVIPIEKGYLPLSFTVRRGKVFESLDDLKNEYKSRIVKAIKNHYDSINKLEGYIEELDNYRDREDSLEKLLDEKI